MHRKRALRALRCICGAVNLVLLVLGVLCVSLGTWFFLKFNDVLTSVPDIKQGEMMTSSKAMMPFYAFLIIGVAVTIVAFCGLWGSLTLDKGYLSCYVMMLTMIVLSLIGIFVAYFYIEDDIRTFLESLFSSFEQNLYGLVEDLEKMALAAFVGLLKQIHRARQCCGFYEPVANLSRSHNTILYWSENTHWGQVMAQQHQFRFNATFDWVPDSCCKQKSDCQLDQFEHWDRFNWTNELENYWTAMIYTDTCIGKSLDFATLAAHHRPMYYAVGIGTPLFIVIVWVMAIFLRYFAGNPSRQRQPPVSHPFVYPQVAEDAPSLVSDSQAPGAVQTQNTDPNITGTTQSTSGDPQNESSPPSKNSSSPNE